MAQQAVKVRGLDEPGGYAAVPDAVERDMVPVVERAASQVAERTSSSVPRRSGALAASATAAGGEASLGGGLAYGGWIEFGGSRGRPYVPEGRYLGAAAKSAEETFADDASRETKSTIARFPWPRAHL